MRACTSCGHRFPTFEQEGNPPDLIRLAGDLRTAINRIEGVVEPETPGAVFLPLLGKVS